MAPLVVLAQMTALYALVSRGLLLRFPFFAAFLLVGAVSTAIYRPLDTAWLDTWWGVGAAALLFRAVATAEAVLILCSRSKGEVWFRAGTWVLALAAAIYCWNEIVDGSPMVGYFHFRDSIQIGLFAALLAPLCIAYLRPDAFPCQKIERRHAACMLGILAVHAMWSLVRTAGFLNLGNEKLEILRMVVYGCSVVAYLTWVMVISRTHSLDA